MTDVYHIVEPVPDWNRTAREMRARGWTDKIDDAIKRNLKNGKIHFAAGIFGLGFGALSRSAIVVNIASALTVTGFSEMEHTLLDRIDKQCPKPPQPGPPIDPH